ncbi:hypothetical protein M0802_002695 [Mischocyttarus mexicanus]|nr:hypothetical protein M0802_002695 [Mischocyttarus mexicanus]
MRYNSTVPLVDYDDYDDYNDYDDNDEDDEDDEDLAWRSLAPGKVLAAVLRAFKRYLNCITISRARSRSLVCWLVDWLVGWLVGWLAHVRQRRAEAYLREGRFEEAAECHEAVADLLTKAFIKLQSSCNKSEPSIINSQSYMPFSGSVHTVETLESLALQQDYHKRQAAIVRMKHAHYEEYKIDLEIKKRNSKQISKQNERGNSTEPMFNKNDGSLRQAIFKTIQEQDSLLSLILVPETESSNTSKHPKDTTTVIEELKTINSHLRSLVETLLVQLEAKEKEVTQLKERLRTVSVSPNDETRTENTHSLNLPPLPPLTVPLFDFTAS